MTTPLSTRELIENLQSTIESEVRQHVSSNDNIALIGFPDYWNAGDSAIWLGAKKVLDNIGCKLSYACGREDYDKAVMASRLQSGKILLLGGGNLGDIWPTEQTFREDILQDFPDNEIIQLPQSICFQDDSALARFRQLCYKHGKFHCMVRDLQSLKIVSQQLELPHSLCPDMAFGLGSLPRTSPAITDILWLARTDKEKRAIFDDGLTRKEDVSSHTYLIQDWVSLNQDETDDSRQANNLKVVIGSLHDSLAELPSEQSINSLLCAYDDLAQVRLDRGLRILSQGRTVITDRLHGYILSLLLEIPHIAMDNSYGKVSTGIVTWTHPCPISYFTNDSSEALAYAEKLLIHATNESKIDEVALNHERKADVNAEALTQHVADAEAMTLASIIQLEPTQKETNADLDELEQEKAAVIEARDAEAKAKTKALAHILALEKEISAWMARYEALTQENRELVNVLSETQATGERMRAEITDRELELAECRHRQRIMTDELLKAEAQIEFIKDLLLQESPESGL
jgi:pyruvyl transferase EpsO